MVILCLYINNKSGGMIYHQEFNGRPRLDENECLRMSSSFHAFYAISQQLTPSEVPDSQNKGGINHIKTDTFDLFCLHTATGITIFFACSPVQSTNYMLQENFLQDVYGTYTDYALKNPFYDLEMPIRNEMFDKAIEILANKFDKNQKQSK